MRAKVKLAEEMLVSVKVYEPSSDRVQEESCEFWKIDASCV